MTKSILTLNAQQAMDFFMKSERFHGFELPEYFVFDEILDFVAKRIADTPYEECISENAPENIVDLNVELLLNKDGKYAVRPLTLSNPYLYYFLVREFCNETGWARSLECFEKYNVPNITSCALPVLKSESKPEPFHNSTTILNWWSSMEQKSLEYSLEYKYMFVTDITNCYGTIDSQAIEMAFSRKNTAFQTFANDDMVKRIVTYLKAFQNGRNIGIPQGSAIFDFIAEFVLGYADLLLHENLEGKMNKGKKGEEKEKIDYKIIRYRDDYRVFCNDIDILQEISYTLQGVLESLNLRLNSQKTMISDSIVTDSIKSDKKYYISNTPIYNRKGVDFDGIQKYLLYILLFGRKFPNGGQLKVMLSDLDKRVSRRLKYAEKVNADRVAFNKENRQPLKVILSDLDKRVSRRLKYAEKVNADRVASDKENRQPYVAILENISAIAAVGTQIAIENVSVVHYALRLISRIVDSIEDENKKGEIITKIQNKLKERPNSNYDQIWLQNITYQQDVKNATCPYNVSLCRFVMGETDKLWNNSWLKSEYTADLPLHSVCDNDRLKELSPVITFRETRDYMEYADFSC